ncbi:UNVERIFIED_CONTAM: hypothetical protein Slati_1353400 [Sesamum latifolium]|uniref:GAG-pre-integrase domain-containing protein n=1 Tax=Sesamum latifolium TaxID=2727402 RepID=A0AAW2XIY3_9LAMI
MAEGWFVQSHGVKMLSLVEKLEDLKLGLTMTRNDPQVRAGCIGRRGFDLQVERQGCQTLEEKKGKGTAVTATASTEGAPSAARRERAKGRLGVLSGRGQMMCAFIAMERGIGRGSVHNSSPTQVLQRSRKLSKDEMILRLGDGKAVAAEAIGSLSLVVSDHVRIDLKDCFFVSSMVKNIISIPMLDSDGYKFLIDKNYFCLVHDYVYHILGTLVNGLYILHQSNLIMTSQHKRKVDNHENAQIWHARLWHISKDRIRRLVDSKSLEIDDLDHLPTCESCLKGKMTKKPFVGQTAIANDLLDLAHTDVCGSLSIPARGGFSYFITFIDDHSRYGLCLPDEVQV